jgi:hypothetical protein
MRGYMVTLGSLGKLALPLMASSKSVVGWATGWNE